jgi:hypothetical protein
MFITGRFFSDRLPPFIIILQRQAANEGFTRPLFLYKLPGMKCMVITYIKSVSIMSDVENLMGFLHFKAIESNNSYRVFSADIKANLSYVVNRINSELEFTDFDIEDSIFIVYPVMSAEGKASMTNIVIKRKGNKYLRKQQH